MKNLTDYKTGLSYEMIKKCEDREQLLQWKAEMFDSLSEVKAQLAKYELEYTPEAGHYDFVWYTRATLAKSVKARLMFFIDTQLGVLRRAEKCHYIEHKQAQYENDNL